MSPLPSRSASATAALLLLCLVATAGHAEEPLPADAATTWSQLLTGADPEHAVPWEFFCTAGRKSRQWTTIPVPSCWEQQGFGDYDYGGALLWNDGAFATEQGLYRRDFAVPASWRGRVVRLVFEGSMTDTTVWINGRQAGPTHMGGFTRFHYDVTDLLTYGPRTDGAPDGSSEANLIEVTVAKVSASRSINDAERAGDYWTFGGIYRPMRLEALPPRFIDRLAVDARADGSLTAAVYLGGLAAGEQVLTADLVDQAGQAVGQPLTLAVPGGATMATLAGAFPGVRPWSAETPVLYALRFTLSAVANGPVLHRQDQRIGFRTIQVRPNDGVYLNGSRIVLKGTNRHCFWPETARSLSAERSVADVRLLKEGNCNAVRMSHYPPDVHFLEACDELGLYVLDELPGWQKAYNTNTSRRMIGELIRRDVNHPSILFWDHGNEGGWNKDTDGEFARWDPQQRPILHPWGTFSDVRTDHYKDYATTAQLSAGPAVFMPTEFLHGLYDGGAGAGLRDYWDVMGRSPTVAGGFLWSFADEGVVRTDQGGRIDNAGNAGPDGALGPHHEKEPSWYAIKAIWSPVLVASPAHALTAANVIQAGWDRRVVLENRYDFIGLDRCTVDWRLVDIADAGTAESVAASGRQAGPTVAPHQRGELILDLPSGWAEVPADGTRLLRITVQDPAGRDLWAWGWRIVPAAGLATPVTAPSAIGTGASISEPDPGHVLVTAGNARWTFDRATGRLAGVSAGGATALPFGNGPRLAAFRRTGKEYVPVAGPATAPVTCTAAIDPQGRAVVEVRGGEVEATWRIGGQDAAVDYRCAFTGEVALLGVQFDLPEDQVVAKRWLGRGPHPVYQNRVDGGVLGLWDCAFNDPIPGQTFADPWFKGYFPEWTRLDLTFRTGLGLTVENASGVPYHGLLQAQDGVGGVGRMPPLGLGFLEVIPAQGTKFSTPEASGPNGRMRTISGGFSGSLMLRVGAP